MKVLIVYASKYGQTEKIATAVADTLRQEGADARAIPVKSLPRGLDLRAYDGVIVAGACYTGRFKRLRKFMRRYGAQLPAVRNALIAVSLSAKFDPANAEKEVHAFVAEFGWLPDTFTCVAGAESFTRYGFLTGFAMRKIATKEGRGGDFTNDREYTDWDALAQFAREFVVKVKNPSVSTVAARP